MKYLKTFENMQENHYALFYYDESEHYAYNIKFSDQLKTFINNNIGYLECVPRNNEWLSVKYDNIPSEILNRFMLDNTILLTKKNIVETAKTKKELEIKLASKKYNL